MEQYLLKGVAAVWLVVGLTVLFFGDRKLLVTKIQAWSCLIIAQVWLVGVILLEQIPKMSALITYYLLTSPIE